MWRYLIPLLAVLSYVVGWYSMAEGAEADYQRAWCVAHGGSMEVVLPDRTRIDCETISEVVEFDFDYKWAEGLGQALHYSRMTGKRGRVVLIGGNNADKISGIVNLYCLPISVEVVPK